MRSDGSALPPGSCCEGSGCEPGFALTVTLAEAVLRAADEALTDAFLLTLVEARGLAFGGGWAHGFLTSSTEKPTTEADREAVRAWLQSRPEVTRAEAGPLVCATCGRGLVAR